MTPLLKIDSVDLTKDLAGCEGLDPNYVTRVRAQFLFVQNSALIQQIQFADAKAAALMTLIGLLALRGPIELGNEPLSVLSMVFGACSGLTVLLCMTAVFPRYPALAKRRNLAQVERWSWLGLSSGELSHDAYSNFMQTSEVSQLIHSVAMSNISVARVLQRKFQFLRLAFITTTLTLIALFVRMATVV